MPRDFSPRTLVPILLLTILAFLIMGYHAGLEDDAFYLAAIKRDLNPSLFPHDSQFFTVQFQATIFDKLIALSVRLTHLPLAWMTLLWQLAAIFFILHGTFRIARRCFAEASAQWAAVTMIAALLTLPISGTAINLADQYLHPRNLATAAILAAIVEVLDTKNDSRKNNRRQWLAAILLAIAFFIHAIMACFGISFCVFLYLTLHASRIRRANPASLAAAFLFPLGWIFEPASDAWRKAASTRGFYYIARWEWYEWLGVFAPLVLLYVYRFWAAQRAGTHQVRLWVAQRFQRCDESDQKNGALAPEDLQQVSLVSALLYYGIFQTVVGLAIMLPASLERLRPFEPMRYLHLLYLIFFLLVGALVGRHVLKTHVYRWFLLFVPLSLGMFYAQRQMYPASAHIEWPRFESKNAGSNNAWLEAFIWIRQNTPVDALFALDPHYMELPGEDYHGFRALAERSVLADYNKDGGMAARVPSLAPRWLREVTALDGWKKFQDADFLRLKKDFGVNWIVVSTNDLIITNASGFSGVIVNPMTVIQSDPVFTCPYVNRGVLVCRLY
jgi:hypothetical protein